MLHTSVRQRHFCTWKPGVACRATDTGSNMGVWPAARTSNCRLCACCVMDCWPARWCGLRRPAVGTQVMAMQLGSSRTQHLSTFEISQVASIFWPFGTTAIHLDSILCLLKFPEASFHGGHDFSSQPNILKTYAPHYGAFQAAAPGSDCTFDMMTQRMASAGCVWL